MSLVHQNNVGVAVSTLPWTYLVGGAAAATALVLLSKKLSGSPTHKNGVPLPPWTTCDMVLAVPAAETKVRVLVQCIPIARACAEANPPRCNSHPTCCISSVVQGLAALVEEYGPVVSFRRGKHVTVVIGRMDAATEIMEKEGGALVDRPHLIAAADILSDGMRLLLEPAGDRFRRLRRAAHTHLQPKAAETYQGIQTQTAKDFILDILNDPKQHIRHAQRYATSVILRVTYGKTSPTSNDDPQVVRVRQVLMNFQKTLRPTAYLVDRIPWLKYLPGYGRELKEFHRFELSLFRDQLNRVRDDMATNSAGPSFGKTLLEHIDDHRLSNDEMAYLAGAFFGAGSDTTASGITVMIMAAACYPEAQARVQEELDEVVGRDRVPTFGDWGILPQLQAFVMEAMRWVPVAPLGIAHRAMKDIIWRGQCIPAGATVMGCHWVISRDPVAFPDPDTFNPQRWLTEDGHVRTDMHFYTYGFGRRICPGQHVANRSLYINLVLLLWSFRILQRPGAPIDPHASEFRDVIVCHPKPFEVEFVPRIEERWLRELMA